MTPFQLHRWPARMREGGWSAAVVLVICLTGAGLFVAETFRNAYSLSVKESPDTRDYARGANQSIFSAPFWFGHRSAGYPLLMRILRVDTDRVASGGNLRQTDAHRLRAFQTVFACLAWLFLAGVVGTRCRRRFFQGAGFLLVLCFALLPEVQLWNLLLLTESLSYSLLALWIGLAILYVQRPRKTTAAAVLVVSLWLVFTRDVYAYGLLAAAGMILAAGMYLAGRRWWLLERIVAGQAPSEEHRAGTPVPPLDRLPRRGAILGWLLFGAGLAGCAALSFHGQNAAWRWVCPLMNVVGKRILTDRDRVDQWREYGAPLDEAVQADAGSFGDVLGQHPDLVRWIRLCGKTAYLRYLTSHLDYTFAQPWLQREKAFAVAPFSIAYYYASAEPAQINRLTGVKPNLERWIPLIFWTFVVLLILTCAIRRAPPWTLVPLAGALIGLAVTLISYHGDAMEVERHCLLPAVQTYLCMAIAVVAWLDAQGPALIARCAALGRYLAWWFLPRIPGPEAAPAPDTAADVESLCHCDERLSLRGCLQPSTWAKWTYAALAVLCAYVLVMAAFFSLSLGTTCVVLFLLGGLWTAGTYGGLRLLGRGVDRLPIWGIVALAFVLRAAWAVGSGGEQTTDFLGYDNHALWIAGGGNWLNPVHSAGAPLLFAVPYALFGHVVWVNQLVLAVLSTLQVGLVYAIARRTMHSTRAGKFAALALAFWPEHVIYTNLLCSEVPYATLGLLAMWLAGCRNRFEWPSVLAAGAVLGMANWVRPTAPILLATTLLYLLARKREGEPFCRRIGLVLIATAGFLLLVWPIAWANYRDRGMYTIVVSQRSGFNLLFGTSIKDRGLYNQSDIDWMKAEVARRGAPPDADREWVYNRVAYELGMQRLRRQPGAILTMGLRHKLTQLWAHPAFLNWSFKTSRFKECEGNVYDFALVYQLLMLGLTVGAIAGRRKWFAVWDERWILAAAAVLASLSHLVLEVQPRYHHGYLPLFALCVGCFGAALGRRTSGRLAAPPPQGDPRQEQGSPS